MKPDLVLPFQAAGVTAVAAADTDDEELSSQSNLVPEKRLNSFDYKSLTGSRSDEKQVFEVAWVRLPFTQANKTTYTWDFNGSSY